MIGVHLCAMTVFLVLFLLCNYIWRYKAKNSYPAAILPYIVFVVLMLWGTLCSIYDQTIGNSIIAFLLAALLSTMSLLIRPVGLFVLLSIAYALFSFGISKTQADPQQFVFNLINGLCITFIAFALGIISWNSNMAKFIQSRLLSQSARELKKANTSKDRFFSILAHDLKGPISSTLALAELLERGSFEDDEVERKKAYKLLQSSLYNSSKLLDNVLLWARNQGGNITYNPVQLNLHQTVESCIEVLKIVAAHKDISIQNLTGKDISIFADQDMIHTIFRNLLSNAIKFTPNLGEVQVLSDQIKNEKSLKDFISVTVVDHGIGMDSTTLDHLFRIENKSTTLGTNNERGTGLGLVLCKDFIEKHGGSIQVQSVQNEGSRFTVTLPV